MSFKIKRLISQLLSIDGTQWISNVSSILFDINDIIDLPRILQIPR